MEEIPSFKPLLTLHKELRPDLEGLPTAVGAQGAEHRGTGIVDIGELASLLAPQPTISLESNQLPNGLGIPCDLRGIGVHQIDLVGLAAEVPCQGQGLPLLAKKSEALEGR